LPAKTFSPKSALPPAWPKVWRNCALRLARVVVLISSLSTLEPMHAIVFGHAATVFNSS
jgi:hypothetical protein